MWTQGVFAELDMAFEAEPTLLMADFGIKRSLNPVAQLAVTDSMALFAMIHGLAVGTD